MQLAFAISLTRFTTLNMVLRSFLAYILLLTPIVSFAQMDSIGIFIPKDDGSPFEWPTLHMWVGKKNPIVPLYPGGHFIRVRTDNGSVDSGDYYYGNYCITPAKQGLVHVYSSQKIWTGQKYDTVETNNTFTAIIQPKISILVSNDHFKKNFNMKLTLIDSLSGKLMSKRYKVGRMYEPWVFDKHDSLIGRIPLCFGTTIDFSKSTSKKQKQILKNGYKIRIWLLVRDMKTDLLIPTNEVLYKLK